MNGMVLVPLILPPTPLASHPNSFAEETCHFPLYFGWRINCLYFRSFLDSAFITDIAWWTSLSILVIRLVNHFSHRLFLRTLRVLAVPELALVLDDLRGCMRRHNLADRFGGCL